MSLHPANLNLVPLLRALLRYRSVTLAARSLDISQSAASQGLAKLRKLMNDQLLVQSNGRMQLTPVANTLVTRVENIGSALDDLFLQSRFDPQSVQRTFLIAANDYMVFTVGRKMLDLQRSKAPGMRLHFVDIGNHLFEQLVAHEVDFAIMPKFALRDLTDAQVRYQPLSSLVIGVMMDRSHPLAGLAEVGASDLAPFECVQFQSEPLGHVPSQHWQPPADLALLWSVMPKVAIRLNHLTLVPTLILGTDLVAIVPYDMGVALSQIWPVEVRKLSFGPSHIEQGLAWSRYFDADPAHAWFRAQINLCFANHDTWQTSSNSETPPQPETPPQR